MACGWNHTVALTRKGEVYTWGSGFDGQLGMADAALDVLTAPRFVSTLMGHTITTLDAGSKFTVAVTSAGKMFAWGENREGQLALPKSSCVRKPKQIFAPAMDDDVVTDVACGWGHVIAKTDSGVFESSRHIAGGLG